MCSSNHEQWIASLPFKTGGGIYKEYLVTNPCPANNLLLSVGKGVASAFLEV